MKQDIEHKYIVACVGQHDPDYDEDGEIDLAMIRGFATKESAVDAMDSLLDGRTNMPVVLLKVERYGQGVLKPRKPKSKSKVEQPPPSRMRMR